MQLWKYWPPWLREVEEFSKLADAEQPELDALSDAVAAVSGHLFLDTISGPSIERWEKILGIRQVAGESEDYHRKRIKNTYGAQMPFTMAWLTVRLDQLIGQGLWNVTVDNNAFTLSVHIDLHAKDQAEPAANLLRRTAPANMVLNVLLLYNQHALLASYTHEQLAARTHNGIKSEVF